MNCVTIVMLILDFIITHVFIFTETFIQVWITVWCSFIVTSRTLWCFIWGKPSGVKPGLKLSIQRMKIMASRSTTSWQIDGKTMETVTGFIFLGSKITSDGDCSHAIKRRLLVGRKAMTNLDRILKSRDITLLTKVHLVKSYGFSSSHVRMWELDHKESWALKNWCF